MAGLSVAYLGPEGTNAHAAAQKVVPGASAYLPVRSIAAVFEAVETVAAGCGVVPIENSIEGGVSFTLDRLLDAAVQIVGEVVLEIEHCLLSSEPSLERVTRVYSHPQALAQCQKWLALHLSTAESIPSASTAGAARDLGHAPGAAAISSRLASEIYGVPVLAEAIQDRAHNATRFVVLGQKTPAPSGKDKTSIVFSTPHEKGALLRVLRIFDHHGINLTRIESRPLPGRIWQYAFFTDLEGHAEDPHVARALTELQSLRPDDGLFKVLGSYPRG